MPDRLAYRRREAAAALGVSLGAIDRMIRAGKLRAVDVGGAVVIPTRELEALLAEPAAKKQRGSDGAAVRDRIMAELGM